MTTMIMMVTLFAFSTSFAFEQEQQNYELAEQQGGGEIATQPSEDSLLNEGLKKYASRSFDEALEYFDMVLQKDPQNEIALNYRGLALMNLQQYKDAASHYESSIQKRPDNTNYHVNLGVALGHLDRHSESILQFRSALEIDPQNIKALQGMGIGFGNLGEYGDSLYYFQRSLQLEPDSTTSKNYVEYTKMIINKYYPKFKTQKPWSIEPLRSDTKQTTTENPGISEKKATGTKESDNNAMGVPSNNRATDDASQSIPKWIKNNARWWSQGTIDDSTFVKGIQFLISTGVVRVHDVPNQTTTDQDTSNPHIPSWVKNSAGWWSQGKLSDSEFASSIEFLINARVIKTPKALTQDSHKQTAQTKPCDTENDSVSKQTTTKAQNENKIELKIMDRIDLKRNLLLVKNQISEEKRYIEFPNPSWFVKKKYFRDPQKWNLEQVLEFGIDNIPDPTYTIKNNSTYVVNYNVYVNDIPRGIPFDYRKTLDKSLDFWSNKEFSYKDKPLYFDFSYTDKRDDANVLVAWVVRDIQALGHATLGKGIVEVSMGDNACDGDFQLYDLKTIEKIMRHEIGHSIGLKHSADKTNIMYPTMTPDYGYCVVAR